MVLIATWLAMARPAAVKAGPATDYMIHAWQTEEGLPQNSVLSIAQTLDRYLWLATFNGLARFDGVRFTPFDTSNLPGLPGNRLVRLTADREGALRIVTEFNTLVRLMAGVCRAFGEGSPCRPVRAVGERGRPGNAVARGGRIWAVALAVGWLPAGGGAARICGIAGTLAGDGCLRVFLVQSPIWAVRFQGRAVAHVAGFDRRCPDVGKSGLCQPGRWLQDGRVRWFAGPRFYLLHEWQLSSGSRKDPSEAGIRQTGHGASARRWMRPLVQLVLGRAAFTAFT